MSIKIHSGDWGAGVAAIGPGWRGRLRIVIPKGLFKGNDSYFLDTDIARMERASEENVKSLGGAAGWGIAGGLLLGPAGVIGGVLLGGRHKDVTFVCVFKDGKKILATANEKTFNQLTVSALKGQMSTP